MEQVKETNRQDAMDIMGIMEGRIRKEGSSACIDNQKK